MRRACVSALPCVLTLVAVVGCSSAGDAGGKGTDTDGSGDGDGGDDVDLSVPGTSGERLKLRTLSVGDAWTVEGFYDTELDIDCQFQDTGDGWRCLPNAGNVISYTDANCTEPAVSFGTECSDGEMGAIGDLTAESVFECGEGTWAVYELVSEFAGPLYRRDDSGACTPEGTDPSTYRAFALEPVPLEDFALGELKVRGEGETRVLTIETDDGARRNRFLANRDGERCEGIEQFGGGVGACVPPIRAYSIENLWTDASCAGEVAGYSTFDPSCGPEPEHILRYDLADPGDCADELRVFLHERGAKLDAAYQGSPGACMPATNYAQLWSLGPEVDVAASFPAVASVELGSGPVATFTGTPDDAPVVFQGFFLPDGRRCFAEDGVDGVRRCFDGTLIGLGEGSPFYFADAGCSEGVVSIAPTCQADYRYAVRRALPNPDACRDLIEEVIALEPYDGDLYAGEPGNCALASAPDGDDLYKLGPTVPLSSFPAYVYDRGG